MATGKHCSSCKLSGLRPLATYLARMEETRKIAHLEPWLTKRQLAAHYGFSIRWVEAQQTAGMPSRLIGGQRRYRLSETDPFVIAEAA